MMDRLITELPFFTPEHHDLVQTVTQFVTREIEPRASDEEDVEGLAREFVQLLAQAGILNYAIAESKLDVRSVCLIREALAYSSSLADLAFVMQGLGTYAIARAAPLCFLDMALRYRAQRSAMTRPRSTMIRCVAANTSARLMRVESSTPMSSIVISAIEAPPMLRFVVMARPISDPR